MITAVDTNVLLDYFSAAPGYAEAARDSLRQALTKGILIACDIVWAETAAHFPDPAHYETCMATLGVAFAPMTSDAAAQAGIAWRAYRKAGGSRKRMIADFLIASHAMTAADQLLTRDRGFYRQHFAALTIIDPSA